MLWFVSGLPFIEFALSLDDVDLSVALLTSLFGLVCSALLVHVGLPIGEVCEALLLP
jgi:hypothetical protein